MDGATQVEGAVQAEAVAGMNYQAETESAAT